ncbi:MAG TPA: hypothetical protein VMU33_10855 [Burkholderiaceae bacterium]|nr:hypothetical protein [Burkholderiaceae bacterium]
MAPVVASFDDVSQSVPGDAVGSAPAGGSPRLADTRVQRVLWVLWPAFLVAAVAELIFFAFVDPSDLHIFGVPLDAPRLPVYTLGFFAFWALCAASGALTVFLQRSPFEVNRCPLVAEDRPAGCPKRGEADACDNCAPG